MTEISYVVPEECPYCDAEGVVRLTKYPQTLMWQGKRIQIERLSCFCGKCNMKFEPAGLFDMNLNRIRQAYRELEVTDEG